MSDINGSIFISPVISGTLTLNDVPSEGWISFPALSLSGVGIAGDISYSSFTLPSLIMSADGIVSPVGNASIYAPTLGLSATGLIGILGNASISLPRLTLQKSTYTSILGDLSITLPSFSFSGKGIVGAVGTFNQDIPKLSFYSSGISSIEGNASVTIPMLILDARVSLSSYLNMVMNIRNQALTLYTNYNFNSLCRFNGKHFGATSAAIYDLDTGTTDSGTLIPWNFRTGYLDMSYKADKRLRQAYLSYKTDGNLILTIVQPDGTSYEYSLEGIETTETELRVKFGKGLNSKYLALDISNIDGSSITLDNLELTLDKLETRR
jgi:hypothetical protein